MSGVAGMTKSPGGRITVDEVVDAQQALESLRNGYLTINSATGVALTAAQILQNKFLRRTGAAGGGIADTLPLAADLIAAAEAFGPFPVGSSFRFGIQDSVGQVITVTTNTGWTLTGTMTLASATFKEFIAIRTGAATMELLGIGAGGAI